MASLMVLLEALGTVLAYLGLWGTCYWVAHVLVHRRKTPPELRGDWWSDFERDFHDYVARSVTTNRKREP